MINEEYLQKITSWEGLNREIFCNIAILWLCCKKTCDEGQGTPATGTEMFINDRDVYKWQRYL